jgi:hypothetical protein
MKLRMRSEEPVARTARTLLLIAATGFALAASGCRAQSPPGRDTANNVFAPAAVRSLRDFGASGDGLSDDTAALKRAFANSDRYCLDGEGRTYRVSGTVRAQKNLCLRNVTLVQSAKPFDTRPYITRSCPVTLDASAVVDCDDPAIPPGQLSRLLKSISVRTLFIRADRPGGTVSVTLDRVKVDRGRFPQGGSRTDSAGIYIDGADGVRLQNVEVTGDGKGYGLMVLRSRNVTADNLWIHDLVWAPYAGDAPLDEDRIESTGWNSAPIHEFRPAGAGATVSKFYGVRVQEQITCALFSEVHNVSIHNIKVSHCMARFRHGDLPWQTDGLDVSQASSDVVVIGAAIDSTWEGMDVVANGDGLTGLRLANLRVSNSFGFGLKLGYALSDARITGATIRNSGIAGIVLYGPVSGITISGSQISGVGVISAEGRTFVPWPAQTHSGIAIGEGPNPRGGGQATPRDVVLENIVVTRPAGAPTYDYGVVNNGGKDVRVRNFSASGFAKAEMSGVSGAR